MLGAPGGTKSATGMLKTIINFFDHGMSPARRCQPRVVDYQAAVVEAEGRVPVRVVDDLRSDGYSVDHRLVNHDAYFAQVEALIVDDDGPPSGPSDPRDDGGIAIASA